MKFGEQSQAWIECIDQTSQSALVVFESAKYFSLRPICAAKGPYFMTLEHSYHNVVRRNKTAKQKRWLLTFVLVPQTHFEQQAHTQPQGDKFWEGVCHT
jgi:hypothetical protein